MNKALVAIGIGLLACSVATAVMEYQKMQHIMRLEAYWRPERYA